MGQCEHGGCFECGAPATCEHHVIPRSLGGTKTVPLCGSCHSRAHGLPGETWGSHSALTAAAMGAMKAAGLYCGGTVPYGYRVDAEGRLEPNPDEVHTKEVAAELRAAGLSLRAVGAALEARGLLMRGGGQWNARSVARLVEAA